VAITEIKTNGFEIAIGEKTDGDNYKDDRSKVMKK
jgi:hypothetical protein